MKASVIYKLYMWVSKLSTIAKIFLTIVALCTTLWGLKIGYDRIIINKHDREQELIDSEIRRDREFKEIKESFEAFNSIVVDSITILSREVRSINTKVNRLLVVNNNLRDYQMTNAKTTDELLQIIKIWDTEKKNSENNLLPIVLRQNE